MLFGIYGASFDEATTADSGGLDQLGWLTWIFLWFTVLGLAGSARRRTHFDETDRIVLTRGS
ncbi:hypothetical protein [Micromonospora citrea]|uniref:hypothetical protein n=1 Tax=Micromonospora citrea TaxID=47855 RepID=UPI000B870308|nr:hypothetical protein [Micromonospora citrea]